MPFLVDALALDDRPCNTDYLQSLAAIGELELCLSPSDVIARIPNASQELTAFEKRKAWLMERLERGETQAFLISIDQWLYGGLLTSRRLWIDQQTALARLAELDLMVRAYPQINFYLTSVLLRLSISVQSSASEKDWKAVFELSQLLDPERLLQPQNQARIAELKSQIPADVLEEYFACRARNFEIQKSLVAWTQLENVRGIWYGQEDCAPLGLHRKEKREILGLSQMLTPEQRSRVFLMTGADELQSLALLRAFQDQYFDSEIIASQELEVRCRDDRALQKISLYEDISILENLEAHLRGTPFSLTFQERDSFGDPTPVGRLVLLGPAGEQQRDLCFETATSLASENRAIAPETQEVLAGLSPHDVLIDLEFANGGDPLLLAQPWIQDSRWQGLGAFSAWNTTGNRLGTAIAQLGIQYLAQIRSHFSESAQRELLELTLIDQVVYCGVIRPKLVGIALERGLSQWALSDQETREFEKIAQDELDQWLDQHPHFHPGWRISLSWNRLFEARLTR